MDPLPLRIMRTIEKNASRSCLTLPSWYDHGDCQGPRWRHYFIPEDARGCGTTQDILNQDRVQIHADVSPPRIYFIKTAFESMLMVLIHTWRCSSRFRDRRWSKRSCLTCRSLLMIAWITTHDGWQFLETQNLELTITWNLGFLMGRHNHEISTL